MALEFETTCSEESSLEITTIDFIGLRRTDRATRARQNFSASGKAIFRRQPGLAALSELAQFQSVKLHVTNGCVPPVPASWPEGESRFNFDGSLETWYPRRHEHKPRLTGPVLVPPKIYS